MKQVLQVMSPIRPNNMLKPVDVEQMSYASLKTVNVLTAREALSWYLQVNIGWM